MKSTASDKVDELGTAKGDPVEETTKEASTEASLAKTVVAKKKARSKVGCLAYGRVLVETLITPY